MTDLNYPIEGKTTEEIARYFGRKEVLVKQAIVEGAKTYADVYESIQNHDFKLAEKAKVAESFEPKPKKKPKKGGQWGRKFF